MKKKLTLENVIVFFVKSIFAIFFFSAFIFAFIISGIAWIFIWPIGKKESNQMQYLFINRKTGKITKFFALKNPQLN